MTHRESLNAAPDLFEALAQNRAGYLKALLYPNRERSRRAEMTNRCSDAEMHKVYEQGVRAVFKERRS